MVCLRGSDIALSRENEKELDNDITSSPEGKCALVTLGIWVTLEMKQSGAN